MKKPIIIVLFCLACGLCSCTQTDSSKKKSVGKTMVTPIDSNYYAQDTIYKPYEKVENKDWEIPSIWNKSNSSNNDNSKPVAKTTVNSRRVVDEIHDSCGLFCDSEKLKKNIEKINVNNVIFVVNSYKNEYGHSIFKAIMRNVFISSDTRADAVKHIKDMYMQAMKRDGIYTDDIGKLIDGHIDYEKNKFGKMSSKLIDRDLKTLSDRIKQTKKGGNTLYQANGKIDSSFKQGIYARDCWIISTIKSLSINPKGQKMLDDIMSIDENGDVTVQLKGVDKRYTISKEELEGANEFAQGDLDVRAIEIAIRRYLNEIGDHAKLFEKIKNRFSGAHIHLSDYNMYNGMHNLSTPYYMLFGKPLVADAQPNKKTIEQIKSGNYSTVVVSHNTYKINHYAFQKYHVYTATKADNKYVYLFNPEIPNEKLKMTHKDFLKFFNTCYSMNL